MNVKMHVMLNKYANVLNSPSDIMSKTFQFPLEDDVEVDIQHASNPISTKNLQLIAKLQALENSNWFTSSIVHPHVIHAQKTASQLPEITKSYVKK